jgi:phage N-6-adenine-methyltransferase
MELDVRGGMMLEETTLIAAPLTYDETDRLAACEEVIERGLAQFEAVGMALLEVRDSRLYRLAYPTFEAYCEARWGLARRRAYQYIEAASAFENVQNFTQTPNEAQARELAGLEPETQREVWQRAVETAPNGKITAAHVRAVTRLNEALAEAPEDVQDVVERFGVSDADTVGELVRLRNARRDTFTEVAASGFIQPGDEDEAVHISDGYKAVRAALDQKVHIHRALGADRLAPMMSSDSGEWYTPAAFMGAVHEVWPFIELDPASSEEANRVIGAQRYFTMEDDALAQDWTSETLYLNPPYGDVIADFIAKLLYEVEAGHVQEAIVLVPARTDTAWFRSLRRYPRCFISGRLKFRQPGTTAENSAPFPSAVIYIGSDLNRFTASFSTLGDVYRLWEV